MANEPKVTMPPIIDSIPNLRDAGGYATGDGRRVRTGLLYRSEQLSHVTEADMPAFAALGIKKVYDLRTLDERTAEPDRVPPGAQGVVVDVLADEKQAAPAELLHLLADPNAANAQLGGGKIVAMFAKAYVDLIILPSARQGFAHLFTEL